MNRSDASEPTTKKRSGSGSSPRLRESPDQAIGKLTLRCTIGGLMLFHGIAKLTDGVGAIADMLASSGLPTFLAYGVYVGEVLAPLLLILGLWTRISAIIIAFNMVMAIVLGHAGELWTLNQFGGWAIEVQALYLFGALSVALLGPGRISAGKSTGILA